MDTIHNREEMCELADVELDAVTGGGTIDNQASRLIVAHSFSGVHTGDILFGVCDDSV